MLCALKPSSHGEYLVKWNTHVHTRWTPPCLAAKALGYQNKQSVDPRRGLVVGSIRPPPSVIAFTGLGLHHSFHSLHSSHSFQRPCPSGTCSDMRSFMGTVTLAALLSTAVALPKVPKLLKIAVKQVPHGKVFKNGALQVNSTYAKFASAGAVAPANVLAAAEVAAQQGSVSASPLQFDQAYLSPVTVGNSELMLDFDTGSADLWVFSTETPTKSAKGHALYNTSSGTSLDGYTWAITYGDGSGASGNVFADKVVIGSVTATSQAVEAATSVAKSFARNTDQDGLVGLAFSKINKVSPQPQTTFFDTVKSSLAAQVFTSALQKGAPGDYTFG